MFLTRRTKTAALLTTAAAMIGAGLALAQPAAAEASGGDNPFEEIPFELRIDLAKAYASPVGETIMKYVREAKPNADELMDGLTDTLGLDPRTAVSTLVLRGEGMNEFDVQLIADLGETTGKLEGWMLSLPGYESDELDDETLLHSFFMDDDAEHEHHEGQTELDHLGNEVHRVFVALPEANGRFTLIATLDDEATIDMAEAVRAGEALLDESDALRGDQVLRLTLESLDGHSMPEGAPGSAVLESIAGLTLTLGSGDDVSAEMFMETSSPARARQVTQLLQGLIAFSQLAAMEQPEMQELANLLADVQIQQLTEDGEPGVSASFSGSHQEFESWVQWFLDNAN